MKKDVLYIIAIIALILYLGYTIRGRRIEVRSLNTMIEVMNDTIEYSKNKEGEWEAEKRSHNLTVKELRRHGQEVGIANENLRKRIGSLNNLVAQLQGQIGVTGTGTVVFQRDTITIIEGDSSRVFLGHRFDWTNDYLSLEGTLDDTYRMDFIYTYYTDFEVTTFWKRPKMFKRKELVVNMTMNDPNAKAMELNNVVIKPDPPKFYETTGFKFGVGVLAGFLIGSR